MGALAAVVSVAFAPNVLATGQDNGPTYHDEDGDGMPDDSDPCPKNPDPTCSRQICERTTITGDGSTFTGESCQYEYNGANPVRCPDGTYAPMARLALLHFVCDSWTVEDPDGDERLRLETRFENERWDVEPDNAAWLHQEAYLASREHNELMAYQGAWEYRKCRAMRTEALEWRGFSFDHLADKAHLWSWPPRHGLTAREISGARSWWSDPLWESAARLGSELAFDRLVLTEGQLREEPMAALFAAMEARNPVFAQRKLAELVYNDTAMLAHAMAAQMLARLQGLGVEWRTGWRGRGKRIWHWTEDGEWVSSWGGRHRFEAHERFEATLEAKRIVARIAAQQGWDADGLDWSQVAAPDDRY